MGVAYGEDLEEARPVIRRALEGLELVNQDKPIEVYAWEFNTSSTDSNVRWWANSAPLELHRGRDQVVSAIKAALDTAGIEIPLPYRTLTFKGSVQLRDRSMDDQTGT